MVQLVTDSHIFNLYQDISENLFAKLKQQQNFNLNITIIYQQNCYHRWILEAPYFRISFLFLDVSFESLIFSTDRSWCIQYSWSSRKTKCRDFASVTLFSILIFGLSRCFRCLKMFEFFCYCVHRCRNYPSYNHVQTLPFHRTLDNKQFVTTLFHLEDMISVDSFRIRSIVEIIQE